MKKITLFILSIIYTTAGICQNLVLTGTLKFAKGDSVEINVPYDGNYWKKASTYLKPNAAGNFHITLPYNAPKFVILVYKEQQHNLLLIPGKPLVVTINATQPTAISFSGKDMSENKLLQKLKLESTENLPFIKDVKLNGYKSYADWSIDSIINIKLPVIKRSLDSTQRVINTSNLLVSTKKILTAEVKYFYANAVADDLGRMLNIRKNRADFNMKFIDAVLSNFTLPAKSELDISINANIYLETYFRFKSWKALFVYNQDKDKEHADKIFKSTTGVGFKELSNDPDRTNEKYLLSTRMTANLPKYAWEKSLVNLLNTFCMQGQLQAAAKLLNFIQLHCNDKQYITASEKMFAPLKKSREEYASNLNIKIRPDYKNVNSVKALLAPYKGKVVFIDMWGTWCPHCIEDMVFEPALKERLKDKDIVFLYVANDEDKDDEKWRDFIFINNLTGDHVRRTSDQLSSLWNELGIPDSEQAYPHYFIFGKDGQILVKNAQRPSGGDALYNELKSAIEK